MRTRVKTRSNLTTQPTPTTQPNPVARAVLVALASAGLVAASVALPAISGIPAPGGGAERAAAAGAGSCPTYGSPGSGEIAGTDANVSVFVGRDYSVGDGAAESEGVLAVGRDATFDKQPGGTFNVGVVGVGSQVTPPPGSDMLVAGGDVSVSPSTVLDVGHGIGGNVVAGGTAGPLAQITTSGGHVTSNATDPLGPFATFGSTIRSRSAAYAALPVTGTTSEQYGTRTFQGDGTSSPQVFQVSGSDLGTASSTVAMRFAGIPADAPVIINVGGTSAEVHPAGFFTDQSPTQIAFGDERFAEVASHTMWNFADADAVTIGTGDQFLGSVLVPSPSATTSITASTNGRVLIGGDLHFTGDGNEAHSYPFPDPDFDCKPEITPPVATGMLAVQKVVDDPAGAVDPSRTYAGTYTCRSAAGDPIPGSFWTVRAGGVPQIIAKNLTVGSVCSLTESPPPNPDPGDPSYVWSPAVITPSTVTIGADATSVITVTNPVARDVGSFQITKALSDPSGIVPPGRLFTGTYDCTHLGADVTPANNTWSVAAGGAAAVAGPVPVGSTCTVHESLGAPPNPADPGSGWGPSLLSPSSVVIGSGATPTLTVRNSVVPVTGAFSLSKIVAGDSAGVDPAVLFDFSYVCTPPGQPASAQVDVRLAAGAQSVVSGVPVGSSCAVTEGVEPPTTDPSYEWQDPEISVSDPAATVSGRTATFTVGAAIAPVVQVAFQDSLTRRTGEFAVQKITIDPRGVVDGDRTFAGVWTCVYRGTQVADGRWQVTAGGGPVTVATGLPVGTSCLANENPGVAAPEAGQPRFGWSAASVTSDSVIVPPDTAVVATLTDIVQEARGGADIVKVVDGPAGAAPTGVHYSGTVVCTPPGGGAATRSTWSIEAGAAPKLLVDGLLEDTTCVVAETTPPSAEAGFEWAPPVVSPDSFTVRAETPVTVTVRNTLEPATPTEPPGPTGPGPGARPGPGTTPTALAFTGSAPQPVGALGLALLGGGMALVGASYAVRRRRTSSGSTSASRPRKSR